MERAGATSTGREGATCRRGIGDGIGSVRVRADFGMALEWVLRAGVVARTEDDFRDFERGAFECGALEREAPDLFRSGRRLARVLARAECRGRREVPPEDLRAGFF